MASESASSDAGRFPAAHRTGMATGELNGMSESVTARVDPGSFSMANMLMNDRTSIQATGCCAWRADRKSTRLNSSHGYISYAVFCLKKKTQTPSRTLETSPHIHRTLRLMAARDLTR